MARVELPVASTPTRAELGNRCHRRHVLQDVLERGKSRSPAAGFGNVIHAGVGTLWLHRVRKKADDALALFEARQAMSAAYAAEQINSDKYSIEMAEQMLSEYSKVGQLAGLMQGIGTWQLVTIEERLELKVGKYLLRFKNDRGLYNAETERMLFIDTKTTSRPDAKWRNQWNRSLQMKLYRYGNLRAYERELDILIEGLAKSGKIGPHYVLVPQHSTAMLEEAVEAFTYVVSQDESLIERAMVNGAVDMELFEDLALTKTVPNFEDCTAYNVECQFLPLCNAEPDERRALLHAEYQEIHQDY